MRDELEDRAVDLDARRTVSYLPSPDGGRVAVLTTPRCPDRPSRRIHLLRHHRFAYDLTHRLLPTTRPLPARLATIHAGHPDTGLGDWPFPVTPPVRWQTNGTALSGLTPTRAGFCPWVGGPSGIGPVRITDTIVAHSLLGLRGRHADPLHWLSEARLLVLVRPAGDDVDAENPYAQSDAVFDSAVRIWPEPLLRSLWYAARADLAVLDPHLGGRRTLCTGTVVADLAVAPDGRHVLAGIVEDLHDLRGLLTQDLINYRVYDTTRPRQPWNLGRLRHGSLRWTSESQPTLVFCDEGRSDEPTRFWTARLGADPVPIGQVTGLVTAWYPATSETVVLVSRQNGEYRLACSSDDTRILPLPGPVRRLARLEVTSRPVLAAFSRGPDGLRAQHLFRVDNGELILLGSAHYDRTVLHQDGEVRLVERRSGGQVSLTRETVTDARTLHRACLAPPPDPTRITTARLDSGAHYEVRRADQPECLPVMVWLVPVQEQEQDEPAPPSVPAPAAAAPGTPAWTYLPELAVVTLTCPLPWSPTATFDEIADRLRTTMVRLLSVLGEQEGLDTDRVVLGGHSFGAAAGAVLLSLLPGRFQCAVLRNGAYNRTLTPAGFQHEHRPFWQAPDIYDGFTATRVAHRISTPVLLVQSEADTNTSTTVVQARSLYDALVVAGCPVRLVLLHNEDHIVHTRQGILTAAREERAWIRRWLTGSTIDAANRQTEEVG